MLNIPTIIVWAHKRLTTKYETIYWIPDVGFYAWTMITASESEINKILTLTIPKLFLLVLAYTYAVLQQVPWVEH